MVECAVRLDPTAEAALWLHEQADGRAYRLIVRPSEGRIILATPASEWVRSGCRIDASKPVTLRAFLDGSTLECFVNDAYAITRRIYDLDGGMVRVTGAGGNVKVERLRVALHTISRPEGR
jgi:sucrose-6-phosphate hydrolase SacC (GH32 family)